MKKAPAFIPTCRHWKLKVVTSDFYPHLVLTDFPSYNNGQNGCCLAYMGNTSNLDSNHFVHHCRCLGNFFIPNSHFNVHTSEEAAHSHQVKKYE